MLSGAEKMKVGVITAGNAVAHKFVVLVERRIGLGDHEFIFCIRGEVFHLVGDKRNDQHLVPC